MQWQRIQEIHPSQWVLIEAITAHTDGVRRIVEDLTVIGLFSDSRTALNSYVDLHERMPQRELYVAHTDCATLEIRQLRWLGIRGR